MKINFKIILGLVLALSVAIGFTQEIETAIQIAPLSLKPADLQTFPSLTEAQVAALTSELDAAPLIMPDALPQSGTFWSLQNPTWPPLPSNTSHVPVWMMDEGNAYLLNDVDFDYNARPQTGRRMMSMGVPDFDDTDGGGTNEFVSYSMSAADYGTNLWIADVVVTNGYLAGVGSNTLADVQYEIQSKTNLLQSDWRSEGFILGSETNSWTPLSVAQGSRTNLFIRLRSWADDGSGLPLWWQQQYFGTNGVDPYGDPDGDGWNNLQEFQNGTNPTTFNTPPSPQGLTVAYNSGSGMANASWQPSPGLVTGYTIERSDGSGAHTFIASTNGFADNVSSGVPDDLGVFGPTIDTTYKVQAHYGTYGDSAWSGPVPLERNSLTASIIPGREGSAWLVVSALPSGTVAIRLTEVDNTDSPATILTNFDLPTSSLTNGLFQLPDLVTPANSLSAQYGLYSSFNWFAQAVGVNSNLSAATLVDSDYNIPYQYSSPENDCDGWLVPPFFDGRAQLKQNLVFQVRAATADFPFEYTYIATNGSFYIAYTNPTNYVYAGFYQFSRIDYDGGTYNFAVGLDTFKPFEDNYRDRNFVFNSSELDSNGRTLTGDGGSYYNSIQGGLTLQEPAGYQFQVPTNGATITALLATNQTRWLASYPLDSYPDYLAEIGIASDGQTNIMAGNAKNYFGLPFLSTKIAYNGGTTTLNAGGINSQYGYFYPETAQPQLQIIGYDLWQVVPYLSPTNSFPGLAGPSATYTNPLLITPVGQPGFNIAGYAKLAILNGYSGVYGYLGQYFDQAYKITNGIITTNQTGILSSYGQFFATEPGPVALVTMPDLDTGERGTCTVYAVSLQLDANHDGSMDLSFNGPDNTSQANPMEFWVDSDDDGHGIGHDIQVVSTNDYDYNSGSIRSQRGLEDFARLWICGMPPLPSAQGYYVTLTCSALSGSPAINLFYAETNGGTGYLTDTNVAKSLINEGMLGSISPSSPYVFAPNFFDGTNKYFLVEGAGIGEGQFTLTIFQGSNAVAQTSTYIDLHDVKDFFEQDVIQDSMSGAKSNWTSSVETVQPATASGLGSDTNIVVLVHGINVQAWDCVNDAETVCKRLYWAGFQGKFAEVEWPCNLLTPIPDPLSPAVFNDSELHGYKASTALTTCLNGLKTRFPNYRLNILAHSQGNTVVSEAIKNGAPFDTYILTQGALPDSAYDVDASVDTDLTSEEHGEYITPESQPMGYRGVYTNSNFNGKIVNFYNPKDKVLDYWMDDQEELKPTSYLSTAHYYYDGTDSYFYPALDDPILVTDPEESRADVSRSRTLPIGQSGPASAHGVIKSAVDLNASFGFVNTVDEHSAQWTRPIQTCLPYYNQVLTQIKPLQ